MSASWNGGSVVNIGAEAVGKEVPCGDWEQKAPGLLTIALQPLAPARQGSALDSAPDLCEVHVLPRGNRDVSPLQVFPLAQAGTLVSVVARGAQVKLKRLDGVGLGVDLRVACNISPGVMTVPRQVTTRNVFLSGSVIVAVPPFVSRVLLQSDLGLGTFQWLDPGGVANSTIPGPFTAPTREIPVLARAAFLRYTAVGADYNWSAAWR